MTVGTGALPGAAISNPYVASLQKWRAINSREQDRCARRLPQNRLVTLHRTPLALACEIICTAPSNDPLAIGYREHFGIIVPLSGSFRYREAANEFFVGTNDVLFSRPGREYSVSHPIGGDRSLLLIPRRDMFELFPAFARASGPDSHLRQNSSELRLIAARMAKVARSGMAALAIDELCIELCNAAAGEKALDAGTSSAGRAATFGKAKEYLHAHFKDPLSLAEVAQAVGVTPIYLTQLFKRSSGAPLHQYLLSLRLNEALATLPGATDLTALALDLGFSSHSHFTAAFRSRFGITPSELRKQPQDVGCSDVPERPITLPHQPLCVARGGRLEEQI